ncbi:AP2/B3-like transcriptional factor family protein, putative isoform 1 [Hibiscus syriacus]|uniref:AP2/B3-like transcriptional factor family protein, putative isoform 1 n=1 Tax=Hibiscus syriacus TaxID=106335 RepID=A0A6A2XBC2_HIBSY|nr:AP2/B3-like transcriptional factor family protein, putative isoform 1 [Hibiscus syriacus]
MRLYEDPWLSFDAAVLPVSHVPDRFKDIHEEQPVHMYPASGDDGKYSGLRYFGEIQEESDIEDGVLDNTLASESAIRRETEGEFRLLGRWEGSRFDNRRFFSLEEEDPAASTSTRRKVSFRMEDHCNENRIRLETGEVSLATLIDDESSTEEDYDGEQECRRKEPEIICRHGLHLVQIYGTKIKYERGAAVALNVRDIKGGGLMEPEVVQMLAEKSGVSLGIGILSHVRVVDNAKQRYSKHEHEDWALHQPMSNGYQDGKNLYFRVKVITASLGFLTNFEDVYKTWAFMAKFLNPSFVETNHLSLISEDSEA